MMMLDNKIINEHYDFLMDKPFFPKIVSYLDELGSMKLKLTITGTNFKQNDDNSLSAKFLANTYWLKETTNCN